MSNPDNLVDDLVRLAIELDYHVDREAHAAERADEAIAAIQGKAESHAAVVAEARAAYDAIASQLPDEVVAAVQAHLDAAKDAEGALDDIKAAARDAAPDLGPAMATGEGAANDITVDIKEG